MRPPQPHSHIILDLNPYVIASLPRLVRGLVPLSAITLLFALALHGQAPTSVQLEGNANPTNFGQGVTFTAHVSASGGNPTGSVSFYDGTNLLSTGGLSQVGSTTNQLLYSSGFTSSQSWGVWAYPDSSYSALTTSALAPDGTNTATEFTVTGSGQGMAIQQYAPQSSVLGKTFTVSVFLRFERACAGYLGTESYPSYEGAGTAFTPTSTWQRYALTHTFQQDGQRVALYLVAGPGCTFYVWGAQLEESSTAGPYVATGGTAASGYGGVASFSTSSLTAGSHSITAAYNGDPNNSSATSGILAQLVEQSPASIELASAPTSTSYGRSVNFTASVTTRGQPSGTVTFKEGDASLGNSGLSQIASTTNELLYSSNYTSTPGYVWDIWAYSNSSYSVVTNTAPAPDGTNTATEFTVTGTGDGMAIEQYVNQSSVLGKTYTMSLFLRFDGACSGYIGTESYPSWEGAGKAFTATSTWQRISLTHTYQQDGQNVSLYLVAAPGCTFYVWGAQLEEASTAGPYVATEATTVSGYGGTATLVTSTLAPGSHSITAVYDGDPNSDSATSGAVNEEITNGTFAEIASSLNPSNYGQSVTLTALVDTLGGNPTGTASFYDGATSLGTGAISQAPSTTNQLLYSSGFTSSPQWDVSAYANSSYSVVTTSAPAPDGTNTATEFTVSGTGDGMAFEQYVNQSSVLGKTYTMSLFLRFDGACSGYIGTESYPSWEGAGKAFTATSAWQRISLSHTYQQDGQNVSLYLVAAPGCTFYVWGAQLEEASSSGPYIATEGAAASGYGGVATFTSNTLIAGAHSITAAYSGDGNFLTSTSPTLVQSVSGNPSAPNISGISPASGPVGTSVTITGLNFGASQGTSTVTFNGVAATASTWSDTSILTAVPGGATTGDVIVTVNGLASNAAGFTVLPAPSITGLSPTSGPVGTSVTISGSNFGDAPGTSTISFNGTLGTSTSWSATSITTAVPTGAASGPVVVTVNGVASNGVAFTVTAPAPNITNVSPASGPVGTLVTITGTNFGATQGTGFVTLGTTQGNVLSWSNTQVTAIVAPGSSTGMVQVTQNGAASNSLPFMIATPTIASVSPTSGPVGTQVAIDGSGFGASQGTSQVLLGTRSGTVVSWSDTEVIATVAPGSLSGTVEILVGGIGSNSLSFTVTPPSITSVSPATGTSGTQVSISGSGFGATQGTGRVMLGTAYASVVSWSDTDVVATVPIGSSSGVAQIWQGGVGSNTQPFTVITPTVTSVSPTSGAAGTQVTISGSGFGANQGSGAAWLGTAYATVVSWSDTQVVATVAQGSSSGVAQVLQNGVWSNTVPFNGLTPLISSVSPTSGAAGTSVTISGSGFGPTQGSGILWLGSAQGDVTGWSDTQVVAIVDASAKTGSVRIQQNGVWSNAVRFVVPTFGSGNEETIVPSVVSMLIGETRTLQALNSSGAVVQGLTWTSSDPTIVSLSQDDPPILTALSPGHVTITAGDSSADVTVYSGSALPTGTVVWSAPGDGSGVQRIVPAVPSPTGVADVFAVMSSGNVQAISADGSVAWTTSLPNSWVLPDFQGGFLAGNGSTVAKVDGATGRVISQFSYSNPSNMAIHPDGTVFVNKGDSVVGIDPTNGNTKFSILLDRATYDDPAGTCDEPPTHEDYPPLTGRLIIAGDGYAYLAYGYWNISSRPVSYDGTLCDSTAQEGWHLRVLRVATDGTSQKIDVQDWRADASYTEYLTDIPHLVEVISTLDGMWPSDDIISSSSLVTNAGIGVTLALNYSLQAYCSYTDSGPTTTVSSGCMPAQNFHRLIVISGGSVVSANDVNVTNPAGTFTPILQAADGTYFGTGVTAQNSMDAFDLSGNVKWSVPGFTPVMATADGGVIAQSSSGQYVQFDQNGVASGMLTSFPTLSWKGAYQDGPIDSVPPPAANIAPSFLAVLGGNLTGNGTSEVHPTIGLGWCGSQTNYGETGSCSGLNSQAGADVQFGYGAYGTPDFQVFADDHPAWVGIVENTALDTLKKAFMPYPVLVRPMKTSQEGTDKSKITYPIFVTGDVNPNTGWSPNQAISFVFYRPIMGQAQVALGAPPSCGNPPCSGWVDFSPTYPPSTPQDEADFESLMRAIGRGIGNTAAHEAGWQFALHYMDCGPHSAGATGPDPCQNGNDFIYEFFSGSGAQYTGPGSGGAQFKYTDVPGQVLHWAPDDVNAIYCKLSPWWMQLLGWGPCGN
jgi:predicted secreted protein